MEHEKVGLTEYITQNEKVITALGVFIAVAGVAGDIVHDQKLSRYIQCIFIILVVILLVELYRKFPKHREVLVELFAVFLYFGACAFILAIVAYNVDLILYLLAGAGLGVVVGLGYWLRMRLGSRK